MHLAQPMYVLSDVNASSATQRVLKQLELRTGVDNRALDVVSEISRCVLNLDGEYHRIKIELIGFNALSYQTKFLIELCSPHQAKRALKRKTLDPVSNDQRPTTNDQDQHQHQHQYQH